MLSSSQTLCINPSLQSGLGKYQRIIGVIFTFYIVFFYFELLAMQSLLPQYRANLLLSYGETLERVLMCRSTDLGICSCCMAQCLCAMTAVFSSIFQVMHINQLESGLIWEKFQNNVDWKEPLEVFIV